MINLKNCKNLKDVSKHIYENFDKDRYRRNLIHEIINSSYIDKDLINEIYKTMTLVEFDFKISCKVFCDYNEYMRIKVCVNGKDFKNIMNNYQSFFDKRCPRIGKNHVIPSSIFSSPRSNIQLEERLHILPGFPFSFLIEIPKTEDYKKLIASIKLVEMENIVFFP